MSRKVIDIETNNLLADMLDYSSLPYKLHKNASLWCVVIRDVDTNEVTVLKSESGNTITKDMLQDALVGTTEIIAHNGIKFDFISLKLFGVLDYTVGYLGQDDTILVFLSKSLIHLFAHAYSTLIDMGDIHLMRGVKS